MATANPDPIDIAVGARLRLRRKALNLSQGALADHLGLTFQQVQKYERGTNRISASMLVRAAEKLETSVAALVGEDATLDVHEPIFQALALPGAPEILEAYRAIGSTRRRRALVDLARSMAAGADETD